MGQWKRKPLPFDRRGSSIVVRTHMINSEAYLALTPYAKVLITLLQIHWRNDKAVDYGVREAAEKIPCDRRTAMKAFKLLETRGFIKMMEYAMFCSRTQSKSRSWRLEWLPFNGKPPVNTWEKWRSD